MIAVTICINWEQPLPVIKIYWTSRYIASLFLDMWKFLDLKVVSLSINGTIFIQTSPFFILCVLFKTPCLCVYTRIWSPVIVILFITGMWLWMSNRQHKKCCKPSRGNEVCTVLLCLKMNVIFFSLLQKCISKFLHSAFWTFELKGSFYIII